MTLRLTPVFLFLLVACFPAEAASARIEEEHARLVCGDAVVEAATQFFDDPAYMERQVIKQSVFVSNNQKNVKKKLRLDSRAAHKPTFDRILLDSLVSAWACLEAKDGKHYLFLWYTCTPMDERGFCAGEGKEWERLFQTDGKALTNSFPRDDKKFDRLYKKLGLEEVVRNAKLQPLTP